jgi:hypothetical protein
MPAVTGSSSTGNQQRWRPSTPEAGTGWRPSAGSASGPSSVPRSNPDPRSPAAGSAPVGSAHPRPFARLHPSLIWLIVMLVSLAILLLSFLIWDRPTVLRQSPPAAVTKQVPR